MHEIVTFKKYIFTRAF